MLLCEEWLRSLPAALLVALLVVNVAGASAAHSSSATDEGGRFLSASITPDLGPQVEPTIAGIAPGAAPWVLKSGHVTLSKDGQLEARRSANTLDRRQRPLIPLLASPAYTRGRYSRDNVVDR